ncbi:MAG: hypothetical protein KGI68_07750 [Alphaproteobacteria bacterium]|nr:hypothetical protein [Alphaproteobacteria bacterium]MDE1987292.1 hypothetical protein [Alphaproteobacteria bacterium]MDE2162091.1 hypothetical protein [Alphaproteobacteria bacterium]MDE2499009.1 hypothetical protein [Alphaproteobacteria bacterium]
MSALHSRTNFLRAATVAASLGLMLAALPLAAQAGSGKDSDFHLSFDVGHEVHESDLGLPIYPGAWPHKGNDHDDSAANIKFLLGWSGLRVAVGKYESNDPPAKIATFYWHALAKYGAVLDCSAARNKDWKSNSEKLDCHDEHSEPGEVTLKVGVEKNQHVVNIKPNGHGSTFALVYVRVGGDQD